MTLHAVRHEPDSPPEHALHTFASITAGGPEAVSIVAHRKGVPTGDRLRVLDGDSGDWANGVTSLFVVARAFPSGTSFEQFADALTTGQGAACGLPGVQRLVSCWDEAGAQSLCLYLAGSAAVLRDSFEWLGLPKAEITPAAALPKTTG